MNRFKAGCLHCLFFIAAILATAPIGALAVISSIADRMERRRRKSWLHDH